MNKRETDKNTSQVPGNPVFYTGDYADFFQRMEELVRLPILPTPAGNIPNPLVNLALHDENDMAAGLLKSWAVVADILSFYRERCAREGYLRTAEEEKSIIELTRAIGYKLKPGLAAKTFLAFTILEIDGLADEITIPAGTAAQGMAEPDQEPVTFETGVDIRARTAWNVIKFYIPMIKQTQEFHPESPRVELASADTGLEPGFHLLICSDANYHFNTISKVRLSELQDEDREDREEQESQEYTTVFLEKDQGQGPDPGKILENPNVFSFAQQCSLFGYNAPQWDTLPDQEKIRYGGTPKGGVFYYDPQINTWIFAGKDLIEKRIEKLAVDKQGNIYAGTEMGLFRSMDQGVTWDPISTGLVMQDIHALYLDQNDYLYAGTSGGGVYRSTDRGDSWEPQQGKLTIQEEDGGKTDENEKKWVVGDYRLPDIVVHTIEDYIFQETIIENPPPVSNGENPRPEPGKYFVFAGTGNGVYYYNPAETTWARLPEISEDPDDKDVLFETKVNALLAFSYNDINTDNKVNVLLAGTHRGLFRMQMSRDCTGETLKTGIGRFIFRMLKKIKGEIHLRGKWEKIGMTSRNGREVKEVYALVRRQTDEKEGNTVEPGPNYLFAGTDLGVFRSAKNGEKGSWTPIGEFYDDKKKPIEVRIVSSLVRYNDKEKNKTSLFAGTPQGVFRSDNLGETWNRFDTGLENPHIKCLAVNTAGFLVSAAPFTGIKEKQWPGFSIQGKQLDLVGAETGIVNDSYLVLKQDASPGSKICICKVLSVIDVIRSDFSMTEDVIRIQAEICHCSGQDGEDGKGPLAGFDLRETRVFAQSEEHELYRKEVPDPDKPPIKGSVIKLNGEVKELKPGQWISITGKLAKIKIPIDTADGETDTETGEYKIAPNGFAGDAKGEPGVHPTQPETTPDSGSDQEPVAMSEIVRIKDAEAKEKGLYTEVQLEHAPQRDYQAETVLICANVAPASHGETVSGEILGSGDAAAANQEFILKKPPLTYLPSSTPGGAEDTLKVWTTGGDPYGYLQEIDPGNIADDMKVRWNETPSFYDSDPLDRDYILEIDEENQAHVMFGDGLHGARLPTGMENITATYRSGLGEQGNVPANALDMLKDAPPELGGVTNPVPATGGTNPQTRENVEKNAPTSVTTMDRIVSLGDYENFTRTFSGIGKARVELLWDGTKGLELVHITAADGSGPLEKESSLYQSLKQAIINNRLISVPFRIDSYKPLHFNLGAKIIAEPNIEAAAPNEPDPLLEDIKKQLKHAFSFENRQFGQGVSASEVIEIIQDINGVKALQLMALYLDGSQPGFNVFIKTETARWDPQTGKILEAQLLTCNTREGGIILEREKNQ